MVKMELPGRKQRERTRKRFVDVLSERRSCRGQGKMDGDDLMWRFIEKAT